MGNYVPSASHVTVTQRYEIICSLTSTKLPAWKLNKV